MLHLALIFALDFLAGSHGREKPGREE